MDQIIEETKRRSVRDGKNFHKEENRKGLVKREIEDEPNRERRRFNSRVVQIAKLFMVGAPTVVIAGATTLSSRDSLLAYEEGKEREKQRWSTLIREIEDAVESKSREERLKELANRYGAQGDDIGGLASELSEAAYQHVCGNLVRAMDRYSSLSKSRKLPRNAITHVNIRLAKTLANQGEFEDSARLLSYICRHGETLELTPDRQLGILREQMNAWYQSYFLRPHLNADVDEWNKFIEKTLEGLIADAAALMRVDDVRDMPLQITNFDVGVTHGIILFANILDYLRTQDGTHLRQHRIRIRDMLNSTRATTGWNRYSPFIALALAGQEIDEARAALTEALSEITGQKLGALRSLEKAAELATGACSLIHFQKEDVRALGLASNPGPVELGLHLAMWGQYGELCLQCGDRTVSWDQVAQFFEGARNLIELSGNRRFACDLERYIHRCEGDVRLSTRRPVPGEVRAFMMPRKNTEVFFPLTPDCLES